MQMLPVLSNAIPFTKASPVAIADFAHNTVPVELYLIVNSAWLALITGKPAEVKALPEYSPVTKILPEASATIPLPVDIELCEFVDFAHIKLPALSYFTMNMAYASPESALNKVVVPKTNRLL